MIAIEITDSELFLLRWIVASWLRAIDAGVINGNDRDHKRAQTVLSKLEAAQN